MDSIIDQTQLDLKEIDTKGQLEQADTIKDLKRRQLIEKAQVFSSKTDSSVTISFKVKKGPKFTIKLEKEATDITAEMLQR